VWKFHDAAAGAYGQERLGRAVTKFGQRSVAPNLPVVCAEITRKESVSAPIGCWGRPYATGVSSHLSDRLQAWQIGDRFRRSS